MEVIAQGVFDGVVGGWCTHGCWLGEASGSGSGNCSTADVSPSTSFPSNCHPISAAPGRSLPPAQHGQRRAIGEPPPLIVLYVLGASLRSPRPAVSGRTTRPACPPWPASALAISRPEYRPAGAAPLRQRRADRWQPRRGAAGQRKKRRQALDRTTGRCDHQQNCEKAVT
jgi:hypothetical protein